MTSFHGDPYRILGLLPGATETQVKSAYRRLVKKYHPDTAGEATIGRFLAVQAAYDALMDPASGRLRTRPRTTARWAPWEADPDRARATRRSQERAGGAGPDSGQGPRRPSPGSPWEWARPGAGREGASEGASGSAGAGSEGAGFDAPGTSGAGSDEPGTSGAGSDEPGTSAGAGDRGRFGRRRQRDHHVPKARPGSTTYDGADRDPEPEWEGATWYGQAMGTYWTINPKEYADPRKHGPEYQARAWRAVAGARGRPAGEVPPDPEGSTGGGPAASAPDTSRGGLLSRILGGRAGRDRGDAE